jgi:hypothetical protein
MDWKVQEQIIGVYLRYSVFSDVACAHRATAATVHQNMVAKDAAACVQLDIHAALQ